MFTESTPTKIQTGPALMEAIQKLPATGTDGLSREHFLRSRSSLSSVLFDCCEMLEQSSARLEVIAASTLAMKHVDYRPEDLYLGIGYAVDDIQDKISLIEMVVRAVATDASYTENGAAS